ncbi:hypothetical protein L2E82_08357 [Cichorium intybus]|uniref:Uncharacterized protein n=1 Tax=Cichorium intybus TaxID=13427 RepID=A0ACB9G6B4_CICIN|nr:hypothetical protein L2E82_08357 [Cichorium intybus]
MKRSVLGYALTCTPSVPATLVHRAHYTSNALFDSNNQVKLVFYETVDSKGKTKIMQLTKEKFAEALHLPIYNSKEMVVPSADQLVSMFNEMGYEPLLERISTFKKNQLPDLWRYFFSIFLRCLSGGTSGLDSASVTFQGLLYGIYYDVKVDFASIIWTDFCSHINHSMKGTEIANARFWAIVVHAHYQQPGYVPDPSLGEMKFTPIAIPILDDAPANFCAQIPNVMLSKVPLECNEVNAYRNTLVIPYPTRDLSQAAPVKEQPKGKGKKKITGGLSESSDSERTPSAVHEEEQEEEQFINQPPSPTPTTRPLSPPQTIIPPSPPKTTQPPSPPPTTAQQTTTIHTTSFDVPPPPPPTTTAPQTSTISSFGIDFSLPEFDLPPSPSRQNPTSAAFFEAFHLAPLATEGVSDEDLPDEGFVLMKQYKVLNSKLDTLIQAQTSFDPTKPTLGDITEEIESLEVTMSKEIRDSVQKLDKNLLDRQNMIQSSFKQKLESAVTGVDKKIEALAKKFEKSHSEVMQTLQGLRSETQKSTKFEKQLDEARAKIEELTAAQAASDISKFTEELQRTNAVLIQDLTAKLRTALQPLINFADKMSRPQGRPATAQHMGHASQGGERPRLTSEGPLFSTITTTTKGASGSAGAGSSTDKSLESIIAPHMEEVYKARLADYHLMIKMNEFSRDNGGMDHRSNQTLWILASELPEEQRATFWTNKIKFHAKYIPRQSVVWSLNKIKQILSIKETETYKGFPNYEFYVLKGANNDESMFTIANFPIMNPMDFIQILQLLRGGEAAQAGLPVFAVNSHTTIEHSSHCGSKHNQNGEIIDEPYGVVFKGLRNETEVMIKFFEIDYLGLHPSSFISGMISHVNAFPVNSKEKKKKFMDHMHWYLAVRKTLKRAYKKNFRT